MNTWGASRRRHVYLYKKLALLYFCHQLCRKPEIKKVSLLKFRHHLPKYSKGSA
ncbi:MAG: hypothetical protein ACI9T9_002615, partial [Oleiphilaceae bacterium]